MCKKKVFTRLAIELKFGHDFIVPPRCSTKLHEVNCEREEMKARITFNLCLFLTELVLLDMMSFSVYIFTLCKFTKKYKTFMGAYAYRDAYYRTMTQMLFVNIFIIFLLLRIIMRSYISILLLLIYFSLSIKLTTLN